MSLRSVAPLILSRDDQLIDQLGRLAAAAGVVPTLVREADEALGPWGQAPVVLLGADCLAELAALGLPRRPRVLAVCRGVPQDWVYRPALACGVEAVHGLPEAEGWLVGVLTDAGDTSGDASRAVAMCSTVGVIGSAGGVGTTVFAAALAAEFARSAPALLVDADPLGAGVDRVLGIEELPGVRWDALVRSAGRLGGRALRESLPQRDDLAVLSWSKERTETLAAPAVREVLSAGRRGFAAVVVDLPRSADELRDEALARCDRVVLVSTLTVPAVTSAARLVRRLPHGRTGLVLRGRAASIEPESVARMLQIPLWSAMADQRRLDEDISLGVGPLRSGRGPLAKAARRTRQQLRNGDSA